MAARVRIRNENGDIQIDDSTINFAMVAKGTATCSTADSSGGVTKYTTTIVVTGRTSPLLALADTVQVSHVYTTVSGSTWTFHIMSPTNGATVNYWVFDRPAEPPARSPGDVKFDIRNAAGELVFWIEAKPLRIVGIGSGTYPSGRTYATIQTANGWRWFETNPGGANRFYRAYYGSSIVNANVVTAGEFLFESYTDFGVGTFTPESYTPPAYQFLVVDVTHF